ncbi:fimbrial protein [Pseudomonas chlororaphis]|uniref:fimbrial protein n=1 Tax=Pseudomonas chlororaphis TaxID=587753 RepID=UPI00160927CE|nr:fimbrial protein [Pseudomonas chlororaphis]
MLFKKMLSTLILVTTLAGTHSAFAACSWSYPPPPAKITIPPLAGTTSLSPAPIGQAMASQKISFYSGGAEFHYCATGDKWGMTLNASGLEPAGLPNVYKTNVEGVGIRIGFDKPLSGNWGGVEYPPFEYQTYPTIPIPFPEQVTIDFIRTGTAVGKGPISFNFSAQFQATGLTPINIVGTNLTTEVANNIYFSACEAQVKSLIVPMGKVASANIRNGNTQAQNFNLNVYCKGLRPTQPAPVKIYFQGATTSDGLLKFNDAGQSHVASGAAIELTNGKGTRLPFTPSKALNLDWQHSQPDAEVYHFSGQARYVPSGGEVKAGKADAVVSYVLVYN